MISDEWRGVAGGIWKTGANDETPATEVTGVSKGAGNGLLSRGLSTGVPSALLGLTTVFGMGTGVAQAL